MIKKIMEVDNKNTEIRNGFPKEVTCKIEDKKYFPEHFHYLQNFLSYI